MIRAYDKIYLANAQKNLALMLDFAVYELHLDAICLFDMFIATGLAKRFGEGDFRLLSGMSGVELAYKVLEDSGLHPLRVEQRIAEERSREYWVGWALAYYQWYTALDFVEIIHYVPLAQIIALYQPYHEMDIMQFVDKMNELYKAAKTATNLKIHRESCGYTQRELAEYADVPLRTIQQYEQGQKDINKAQFQTVVKLAKALFCEPEMLLEKVGA